MSYPHIHPIKPSRDGWGLVYDSPARRLLHHCGLIPRGLSDDPSAPIDWIVHPKIMRENWITTRTGSEIKTVAIRKPKIK
jgi:hypothetical protein